MAEPGKETAATPPPLPQETVLQAPAVAEPASQDTETAGGGAATLDSALPIAESVHRAPPQETAAVAAVGAPGQTTEADGQPPVATMPPQKVPALPPPAETPAQESAPPPPPPPPQETAAVAAVGKPDQTTTAADPHPPPPVPTLPQKVATSPPPAETPAQESAPPATPTPPPPQKQEEETDAPKAREKEGEDKRARRRWRCLRAAVCLLFLRPKRGETKPATPPADKHPASGLEEKKPTPGEMPPPPPSQKDPSKPEAGKGREGETKPAALDASHERTATAAEAAEAEKPLATPTPRKQEGGAPEQDPSVQEDKDAARASARAQEGEETKQPVLPSELEDKKSTPGEMPLQVDSAGKPGMEKSEDDMKPPAQDGKKRPLMKKFQMAGRLVQYVMSLYNKHRRSQSQKKEEGREVKRSASALEEKQKQQTASDQKQKTPHENWPRVEVRLEDILEEAFTRLLAAEYVKELKGVSQKCLLTFSVFDLASEVKKQAMIYWWVAEFKLRHRSDPPALAPAGGGGAAPPQGKGADAESRAGDAEGIFSMLSDHGFLVPKKNWCTKVIHGCQVNPLVHWMLKRQARDDRFAELDDKGSPAYQQPDSSILCLTAGNRPILQKMRVADESQPQAQGRKKDKSWPQSQAGRTSKKVTKKPSLQGKESNHVQEQDPQQPTTTTTTTKDGAQQVGSKSMAAADKAPSKKGQDDPTQDKDQLTKSKEGNHVQNQHQQQPTTNDKVQRVGSKSMAAADKAPSKKDDEDPTQAKDHVTKGSQNISVPEHVDETIQNLARLFEGKRVILNVNAHVYPISKSVFLNLAECLVVLQLGRWNYLDDNTYMEVDGLMESWNTIGLLKNLRYLGLRGLSGLTELPKGIESLEKLVILDMRGCQNLVKVQFKKDLVKMAVGLIKQWKQLTHLDLKECYMLEHIDQGITSLTELQVFKGFVFATGTQVRKACRIQDLRRLKKLQKLTVSITTDANVGKGEMADLQYLTSLRKLTITWSEIPSILNGEKEEQKRVELIDRWTSFRLPNGLMKLDIRCYPKKKLEFARKHTTLEKLYLRGGDMEEFFTHKSTSIKTLRLRYLKNFTMKWEDIHSELEKLEYVEIVVNKDATREKDESEVKKDIEDEVFKSMKKVMKIPDFTLDWDGVWTKDEKEEHHQKLSAANNKDAMGKNEASGSSEPAQDSSTKDASATPSVNKNGDDDKAAAK